MSSSLLAGVSGLRSYQTMLEVIGNNLANVSTPGFKSSTVSFSDLLSQTVRAGSDGAGGVGGTNPIQIGLGVQAAAVTPNFSQGSLSSTGRVFDLALQGEGFFVVNDGQQNYFTRVGTFDVDRNSDLVEIGTGFRVMDVNNNPINIPLNTNTPGQATQNIIVQGNLDASASGPRQETLLSDNPFTVGGVAATAATALNSLDGVITPYTDGDVIQITGVDFDGNAVSGAFTYGAANDGTTLGDLLAAISATFDGASASLTSAGDIELKADAEGPTTLVLTLTDAVGNSGAFPFGNHQFDTSVEGVEGAVRRTSITVFDGQATPHTLSLIFQKRDDNIWDLTASIPEDEGTMIDGRIDGITFGDDGSLSRVTGTGEGDLGIEIQFNGLGTTQRVNINLGDPNSVSGLTQFGGEQTATAIDQDGYGAGSLSSVAVREDGTIMGIYTNGVTSEIGILQVATFSNPAGLRRAGDNMYLPGPNSGPAVIAQAMTGSAGAVTSGALESSNVDIALEFTRLITAQRGFQVNARTITATDQILQELANMLR